MIEFCRALSIAVYDDKNVTAVEAILSGGPKYSELLDFKKAELWVLYKTASTKNEFEKLIKRAQALLDVYEADGEIQRFAGYGFYQLGNREKAEELYLEAVKNTRNGFVWREARELLGIDAYQIVDFVQDCVGGEDSEEEDEEDE